MKYFTKLEESKSHKYLQMTDIYLLAIPFSMHKEYNEYQEFSSLDEDELNDVENAQKWLEMMSDEKRVKVSINKIAPSVKYGIHNICTIALKHESNDKAKNIYQEILDNIL